MPDKKSSFSCSVVLGLLLVLTFASFVFATSMTARAEQLFGPPAPQLGATQRLQLSLTLGWRAEVLRRPVDPAASTQDFEISLGEATDSIIQRLQAAGLIRDRALFRDYLVYTGLDTQLQAGRFELSAAMPGPELAAALLDPTPGLVTVAVLPGWRLEEIAASLDSAGVEMSAEDFLAAARGRYDGFDFLADLPESASLEGYLLPGAVEVERDIAAAELVQLLLGGFQSAAGPELLAGFAAQGLSLHEAVTLASIVERESVIDAEMPMIASVFLNRVSAGLKLEADPTVQYALGFDAATGNWWTNPLFTGHLSVNSPYNTYLVGGLPPGPIAAPSLEALQAVAFPQETAYFFFQAECDGTGAHVFAETFDEHLSNNCE